MERKRAKSGEIRLTEVAELAGVSPITASRFFRNPQALSLSKRERVASAAKELGYVPNLAARALASQRTEVIGVLIPSLTNNVFSDVLRGIYDASEGSRYSVQLANTRYSILQEEQLLRLFQAQKPAGLIVTGIDQTPESRSILESGSGRRSNTISSFWQICHGCAFTIGRWSLEFRVKLFSEEFPVRKKCLIVSLRPSR